MGPGVYIQEQHNGVYIVVLLQFYIYPPQLIFTYLIQNISTWVAEAQPKTVLIFRYLKVATVKSV